MRWSLLFLLVAGVLVRGQEVVDVGEGSREGSGEESGEGNGDSGEGESIAAGGSGDEGSNEGSDEGSGDEGSGVEEGSGDEEGSGVSVRVVESATYSMGAVGATTISIRLDRLAGQERLHMVCQ